MQRSETITKLAESLSKFQSAVTMPSKNRNNFFGRKYADLGAIFAAIQNPLADQGLSITQPISFTQEGKLIIETYLLHTSGEWIASTYPVNPVKDDPQSMGSAITYARRYSISSLLGIASEDDDDANEATNLIQRQKTSKKPAPTATKTSSEDNVVSKSTTEPPATGNYYQNSKKTDGENPPKAYQPKDWGEFFAHAYNKWHVTSGQIANKLGYANTAQLKVNNKSTLGELWATLSLTLTPAKVDEQESKSNT